ncbi:MAG: branched-chain amino acid ABC transporter substrate-binding protein [Bacilli bacterium]
MKAKKLSMLTASALLAFGVLTGCNSGSDEGGELKVVQIATQTPLSGGSATLGESIKLGAQLKLDEEKEKFKALGIDIQLVSYDDQGDPKKGVANAQDIQSKGEILAVVGHLNSGVSIAASDTYEKNAISMVSPANTAVELTEAGKKTVNRIVARDDLQGPAGARYAFNDLGLKKVYVLQDKTAYGVGLANAFKAEFEKLGGEVLGDDGVTQGEKDFNGVINAVKAKNPDFVFFGGLYSEGGIIVKQMVEKGINIPFLGGDGLDSSTLVEIAGDAVKNVLMTSVAGDVTQSEEGKKFAENYKAKFNKNIESFSAYGYDSMGVVLAGLEQAVKDNGNAVPTREQLRDAIRVVKDYQGIATQVTFDEKGDNAFAKVYVYKFEEAVYPAKQVAQIQK